ncbi:unnamed protein product [Rotaria socialis]|uniref:VWFA domain-containing protein n=1 Tax=Rotaria socialis TaxID=392032 RepID=A0A820LIP3_9BILA|nr:unnamed protein product [Rotaria socialis]CAF4357987.1 unnamed protein product [Rotaria socialis]
MAMANYSQTSNTLEECSICLSPLAQQSIDNIQARNNVCPLCRTRLDSLVDILNGPVTATGSVLTQNIPTPILTRTLIPLTVRKTGIWAKLTKPITNAFKRGSNKNACTCCRDYRAFPSLIQSMKKMFVTALFNRITAGRQQCIEGHTKFPSITARTELEFGGQESPKQSNIYGMVTLNAPSIRSNEASEKQLDELHIPVDLISVVDQSGSMQGKRIALLKETLNYIVDRMGPLDRLAIVSFDTTAFDLSQDLELMTTEK